MNRKKLTALTLAAALALSLSACGEPAAPGPTGSTAPSASPETSVSMHTPEPETTARPVAVDALFSELKNLEFYFSSGAGGWRTVLHIDGSGGFSGTYSDSDMGGSGEDGIWGIQYRCDFTGQLTQPVRVNDYTYSVRIDEITYEKEAGTDEAVGGTHYYYTDPYGLEDAEELLIYLPGAPLGQLSEEFRGWVGYYDNTRDELPFYALNNEVHQQGFSSYDRL